MSDPYKNYFEKKDAYEAATLAAETCIGQLKKFTDPLLENWRSCYIELSGSSAPTGMAKGRDMLDGSEIPSPEELRNSLVNQYEAQVTANEAWLALSERERAELKAPPCIGKR